MFRTVGFAVALAFMAGSACAQGLTVLGLDGKTTVLTAAQVADLPRASALLHAGDKATPYEGATLTAILREAGVPQGPRMHGDPMHAYVVVVGPDGYKVTLSLAEVDPEFRKGPVVLADTKAGAALDEKEGPYRLVIGDDLKPWRAVHGVVRIEVRSAP
jgi:hypothetical protein